MGVTCAIAETRLVEIMTDDVGDAHDRIADGFVRIEIGHGDNAGATSA